MCIKGNYVLISLGMFDQNRSSYLKVVEGQSFNYWGGGLLTNSNKAYIRVPQIKFIANISNSRVG